MILIKRRICDNLSYLMNWLFAVQFLLCIVFFGVLFADGNDALYNLLYKFEEFSSWMQVLIFILLLFLSVFTWKTDYIFPWSTVLISLLRTIFSLIIILMIELIYSVPEKGFTIII